MSLDNFTFCNFAMWSFFDFRHLRPRKVDFEAASAKYPDSVTKTIEIPALKQMKAQIDCDVGVMSLLTTIARCRCSAKTDL